MGKAMTRMVRNEDVLWANEDGFTFDYRGWKNEDLNGLLFLVEGMENDNDHACIMDFADLTDWFNDWDQEEDEIRYENVYDYLWDALAEGIWVVRVKEGC